MKFDAAIFDLDGTLLDSLEDIGTAANRVLVELGKPAYPLENYKYLVGDGVAVLFHRALPETEFDSDLRTTCMHLFEQFYSQEWNRRSKPYDGILDVLKSVAEAGVKIAVLSNKPDEFTKRCVSHFFPEVSFDMVVGHSPRFPRKPDPSSANWMREHWGIDASRIAYVGDTNTDMKTAVSASFYAIGVTWGFRPESELREHGAQEIAYFPGELQNLLLNS